jgi:hypothetical protein
VNVCTRIYELHNGSRWLWIFRRLRFLRTTVECFPSSGFEKLPLDVPRHLDANQTLSDSTFAGHPPDPRYQTRRTRDVCPYVPPVFRGAIFRRQLVPSYIWRPLCTYRPHSSKGFLLPNCLPYIELPCSFGSRGINVDLPCTNTPTASHSLSGCISDHCIVTEVLGRVSHLWRLGKPCLLSSWPSGSARQWGHRCCS